MREPIGPHCLVTKITNDSVHFILLACLALLLDTHWLFQCELASCTLCCCSVWPHRLARLFWYLLSSLSGALATPVHGSESLTHFGEFSLLLQLQEKEFVCYEGRPLTRLCSQQVILHWILGFDTTV